METKTKTKTWHVLSIKSKLERTEEHTYNDKYEGICKSQDKT